MSNEQGYVTLEGEELRRATLKAAGWTDFGQHHTPRVESSVDAALEYLTLPERLYWEMEGPSDLDENWSARLIDSSMCRTQASASNKSLAVAMCRAYLEYKAGA